MSNKNKEVTCIKNAGYETSLVLGKKYQLIPDQFAEKHSLLRVIDETGEAYFYHKRYFVTCKDLEE